MGSLKKQWLPIYMLPDAWHYSKVFMTLEWV